MMKLKLGLTLLICLIMTGCATGQMTAPCDQYASFCGAKTKINQW